MTGLLVTIAVQAGKTDERGEEVYDPIIERRLTAPDIYGPWPSLGEILALEGKRYEVLQVIWDLDDRKATYLVKPES